MERMKALLMKAHKGRSGGSCPKPVPLCYVSAVFYVFLFLIVIFSAFAFETCASAARKEIISPPASKVKMADVLKEPFLNHAELTAAKKKFYTGVKNQILDLTIPFIILALLVFSGAGRGIYGMSGRISKKHLLQLAIFTALFWLSFSLLKLPYDFWVCRASSPAAGPAHALMTAVSNAIKSWAMISVALIIISVPFLWLLRVKPRTWWRWPVLVGAVLVFIMFTIQSYSSFSIDSSFKQMRESPMRSRFEAILDKAGNSGLPIYTKETPKNKKTETLNGFGGGIPPKIYIWGYENSAPESAEFVFAHELTHYKYMHFWLFVPLAMIFLTVFLLLGGFLTEALGRKYSARVGYEKRWEIPALPAWLMLFALFYCFIFP